MRQPLTLLAALVACAAAGQPGRAGFFTSEGAFLAALTPGSSYTESFDQAIPNLPTGPTAQSFSGNGFGYTVSAPGGLYQSSDRGFNNTPFLSAGTSNDSLTINFSSGSVTGVGGYFFFTDFDNNFTTQPVSLTFSDGTTRSYTPTGVGSSYFGYTSASSLRSLTFTGLTFDFGNPYNTVDNLTVGRAIPVGGLGNAVPLPPTALMAGVVGLVGLLGAARRRPA